MKVDQLKLRLSVRLSVMSVMTGLEEDIDDYR